MTDPYAEETRWSINRDEIPWLQIFIEGTAIVVSILLAFAIDAWWEKRALAQEEREILVGLEAEFVDVRERLDYWADMTSTAMILIEKYLSDDVEQMSLREIERMFAQAGPLANVLDQGGPLDALLASGRLERITSEKLRIRLAKWPDLMEDIHSNDLSIREFSHRSIVPYLAQQGIPRRLCPLENMFCAPDAPVPNDYLRLARNDEFRALLINRHLFHSFAALDHKNAAAEAGAILELIQLELGRSGGPR